MAVLSLKFGNWTSSMERVIVMFYNGTIFPRVCVCVCVVLCDLLVYCCCFVCFSG